MARWVGLPEEPKFPLYISLITAAATWRTLIDPLWLNFLQLNLTLLYFRLRQAFHITQQDPLASRVSYCHGADGGGYFFSSFHPDLE